ncbi:MAG: hypothetical protein CVV24_12110 [Ignavibacteriae bacterium HGW-Ignavibacteriae-3]|nr:MAG: hypothetical protein CVV24_12110 [Ignavibacteriae bacterium HGW-Ignavibacteriae-3]
MTNARSTGITELNPQKNEDALMPRPWFSIAGLFFGIIYSLKHKERTEPRMTGSYWISSFLS